MKPRKSHHRLRNNHRSHKGSGGPNPRHGGKAILPPPDVLQEYEYATQGAADRLLAMAEAEQVRRHQWENDYMAYYKKSLRIGQVFGVLFLLAVVIAVVVLGVLGKEHVASTLAMSAFGAVVLCSLFVQRGKKKTSRPTQRRSHTKPKSAKKDGGSQNQPIKKNTKQDHASPANDADGVSGDDDVSSRAA